MAGDAALPARPRTLSLLPHSRSASQLLDSGGIPADALMKRSSWCSDPCTPSVRALVQVLEGKSSSSAAGILPPPPPPPPPPSGSASASGPSGNDGNAAGACFKPPMAPGIRAIRTAECGSGDNPSASSKDEGYSTMSSDVQVIIIN